MGKKLGEILLQRGQLTKAQLQTALRTQEFFGGHLGSIFIELGFIKEETLGEILAETSRVLYAPPELLDGIPHEVIALLSRDMAEKHRAVPLRSEGREIHLAMLHPKDHRALVALGNATKMTVVPYITPEFRLFDALERYYKIVRDRPRRISLGHSQDPFETPSVPALERAWAEPRVETAAGTASVSGEVGLDGLPLDADFGEESALVNVQHARQETETILRQLPRDRSDFETPLVGTEPALPEPPTPLPGPSRTAPPPAPLPGPQAESSATPPPPVRPAHQQAQQESLQQAADSSAQNPLAQSARRFLEARNRDEIGEVLLQITQTFFQRRLLFIVQRDRIVGWDGCGKGVPRDRIKRVLLPMDSLSLFTAVKVGLRPMVGPVADVPANRRLFADLGLQVPNEVMLLPILIKDRVVAVLYGDNGAQSIGGLDVDLLRRFTMQSAIALEILLLRTKLLSF